MTNIFIVKGSSTRHSLETSKTWIVCAFKNYEDAGRFADRLNAWCRCYGADTGALGYAARAAKAKVVGDQMEAFYDTWWAEHGTPELSWHGVRFGLQIDEEAYGIALQKMYDAYTEWLEAHPVPVLEGPPEDPQFTLLDCGVQYTIESLELKE